VGRRAAELAAADHNPAARTRQEAEDPHQGCGLAGAVATEKRDGFAFGSGQVEVEDDVRLAVVDIEARDLEDSYAVSSSSPR
jgi:hypothetical protein